MSERRSLLPYFCISGSMALGYGSIYTLLADLRDRYGFSGTQLGLIVAAGFAAGFCAQLLLARQADRGRAALMIRLGVFGAALAMVGSAIATEFWAFVPARVLLGLGSGTVGPAIRRIVITRDPDDVGVNLGRLASFDVSGFVLGPLVAAGPVSHERRVLRDLFALRPLRAALAACVAFYVTVGMFEAVWPLLLRDRGTETWLIGLFAGVAYEHAGRLAVCAGTATVMIVFLSIAITLSRTREVVSSA